MADVLKWKIGTMLYTRDQLRIEYKTRRVDGSEDLLLTSKNNPNICFVSRHYWANYGQRFA